MLSEWDQLPARMKTEAVRPYYEVLEGKKLQLMMKRVFDVVASFLGLIVISPVLLVLSVQIHDSRNCQCRRRVLHVKGKQPAGDESWSVHAQIPLG